MHFFQPQIPKKNVDLGLDAWRKAWEAAGNDPSRLSIPQVKGRTVGFTSSQREYSTELQHPTNRGYELTRIKGHKKIFRIETSRAKRIRNRETIRASNYYYQRNKRKPKRNSPPNRKRRRRYSPKTPRKSAKQSTNSKKRKKKSNTTKKRNTGATETEAVIYGQSSNDTINSKYKTVYLKDPSVQDIIDLTLGTQTPGYITTTAPPSLPTSRLSRSPTTDTEPDSLDYGSEEFLREQMEAAEAHNGLPVKKLPSYKSWNEMGTVMKQIREVLFTAFLFSLCFGVLCYFSGLRVFLCFFFLLRICLSPFVAISLQTNRKSLPNWIGSPKF